MPTAMTRGRPLFPRPQEHSHKQSSTYLKKPWVVHKVSSGGQPCWQQAAQLCEWSSALSYRLHCSSVSQGLHFLLAAPIAAGAGCCTCSFMVSHLPCCILWGLGWLILSPHLLRSSGTTVSNYDLLCVDSVLRMWIWTFEQCQNLLVMERDDWILHLWQPPKSCGMGRKCYELDVICPLIVYVLDVWGPVWWCWEVVNLWEESLTFCNTRFLTRLSHTH